MGIAALCTVSLVANAKHQPKLKLWGELLTIWAWAQHCAWVVGGLPLGLNLNVDCSRGVQFATIGMGAVAYACDSGLLLLLLLSRA